MNLGNFDALIANLHSVLRSGNVFCLILTKIIDKTV